MKNLNSAFLDALTAETRTVIRCAKIERRDGEVFGLTELDQDLVIDGVTYKSLHGLSPTAIASDLSFQSNNVELTGLISDNGISLTDVRLGFFDYAKIQVFLTNWSDLPTTLSGNSPKFLLLPVRVMGKVSYSDGQFTAEVMGLSRFLDAKIPRATSPNCRYKFGVNQGYSKCAVNVDSFATNLTVTDGRTELSFFTSWGGDNDRFTGGNLIWLSGPNQGLTVGIIKQLGNTFFLAEPLPVTPDQGHNFRARPNCQKTLNACRSFNNQVNFGGEDKIPGLDSYISMENQG